MMPTTRYARSGEVSVAYQVVGNGPIDLVVALGAITNLDYQWEEPRYVRFFSRLAAFSRLILFDKRGMGLSDRSVGIATLEERMDDVRAVMDAVGSASAAVMGISEGGPMTALFAATYPERTRALVLYGSFVRGVAAPGIPSARTAAQIEADIAAAMQHWGEDGFGLDGLAPSVATDERFGRWWGRLMRSSASPAAMVALERMIAQIDISEVLPTIRVPTLVMHRTHDTLEPVAIAHYLAARIPGARLVELPGIDHLPITDDQDALLDEVETFLTGVRPAREVDRILATVLVLELVNPTAQAIELGERRWRARCDQFHEFVQDALRRFRGQATTTTHERVVATFDGPARAIHCAEALQMFARSLELPSRAGVHTGELELRGDEFGGLTMQRAAWVMTRAQPGETLASRTVRDLVAGAGIRFLDRGPHSVADGADAWQLYAATTSPLSVVPQPSPGDSPGAASDGRGSRAAGVADLTPRELDVLRLLVEGRSNQEIAAELSISPRTVESHVANILGKLSLDSRAAVAVYAVRQGLV